MGKGIVTAILCIHMLLWSPCNLTVNMRKLGSEEILLREAQPIKSPWRKLLQDKSLEPNPVNVETPKADVAEEPDDVDVQHSHAEDEGKAEVKEENVMLDAKIETPKESLTEDAGKAEVKEENVVLDAKIEMPVTDTPSPSGSGEEVESSSTITATSVQDDDAQIPTTDEEGHGIQADPKEEVSSKSTDGDPSTTETSNTEKAEDSNPEATAQPQDVHVEENTTDSIGEDAVAEIPEKKAETMEVEQQNSPENVTDLDSRQTEEVRAQIVPVKVEDLKEKKGVEGHKNVSNVDTLSELLEDGKEGVVAVDDEPKVEAASTVETVTVVENTETNEGPSEGNPTTAVETDSDENQSDDAKIKMVESAEHHDEKEQLALDLPPGASVEEQGSSDSTVDSDGETSNSADVKVDSDNIEGKQASSNDTTEIPDKAGEGNKEVSQPKSAEVGEEKRELSNENTELLVKDGENKDTKEGPQVEKENMEENPREESVEAASQVESEENEDVHDKEGDSNDAEEVKPDDETQAAAKEVESQLEALKRDTVLDTTTDDQRQEIDPSDDEYDIIQGIVDLPTKFQETAEKVADHLRPDLRRWSDTSKEYFNLANQQISESFSPLIGRQYAPFFALMISYGVLLLPLIVVILLFDHIKALFSLQKVLLFINIYLAAYFATLWFASFIIGLEPMSFFYHNSLSSYLSLQLLQALGYVVYLMLQTVNSINSCTSETRVGKVTTWLQWVVAMGIGLHYYVTVFHPAVASRPPHTSWKFYAAYSAAFCILCLFARIRWVKKDYLSHGNAMAYNKRS